MKYITKKPNVLFNRANNGKYPWEMREPRRLEIPAGTIVELHKQDTSVGRYYEIVYRHNGVVFELSEKVNDINYGKK